MKKLLLLSLSLLAFSSVQAKQIDTSTVLNNARRFCANTIDKQQGVEKVLDLVYTESTNGADNFYIFNVGKNDGFVIMSADDCAESVLGYSDEGCFDPDNIPSNLKYMLDEYKREINYAIEHNLTTTTSATSDTKTAIKPIVKTKWNQDSPYNDLCPEYQTGSKSASGCTATAMAQVMKCFNWPEQGNGSKTYTTETLKKQLSANFGETTYEWDYMPNKFSESSSTIERTAVATLLYHCGVGANMNYGESSGASFNNAYKAFVNYFRYDKSTKYTHRRYYSVSEWNNLIYNELKNNRPVLYAGYNDEGGHAYVCDGYSKDNYFHINWGWGGMADGYFKLSALDPDSQGIGGSSSGYNTGQEIIYNFSKEKGTEQMYSSVGVTNGFKVDQSSVSTSSNSSLTISWTGGNSTDGKYIIIYHPSLSYVNIQFGVIAENTTTNERKYIGSSNSSNLMGGTYYQSYFSSFSINISDLKTLAAGSYKLYPAFKNGSTGTTDVIQITYGYAKYLDMTVTSSNIKFDTPTVEMGTAVLTSLEPSTSMYVGKVFDSVAKLTCKDGDYSGNVTPKIKNGDGDIVYTGDSYNIDMEEGEEITKHIAFTAPSNITPGNYRYYLVDDNDEMLGNEFTELTVKAAPTTNTATAKNLSLGDNNNVDADNMQLTATISCTAGYFDHEMYAFIYDAESNYIAYMGPANAFVEAGQSAQITMNGAAPLEPGDIGYVAIYDYTAEEWLSTTLDFTVGDFTGIQSAENVAEVSIYPNPATDRVNITTPEAISGIEVYSMAGNLVAKQTADGSNSATIDVENLATGIYMVKIATENATYVKRVIKK